MSIQLFIVKLLKKMEQLEKQFKNEQLNFKSYKREGQKKIHCNMQFLLYFTNHHIYFHGYIEPELPLKTLLTPF